MRTKKGLLILAMAVMLISSCVLVGMAQGIGNLCTQAGNLGLDHDTCVVCFNSSISVGNQANCLCKIVGDVFGFPADLTAIFGVGGVVENHGQCINALKPFL